MRNFNFTWLSPIAGTISVLMIMATPVMANQEDALQQNQPINDCYVYTTELLHGCAPFLVNGAYACAGSLCTAHSTCTAGTRGFEINDDDYWNMYQNYTFNNTDPDRSGKAAPITIKCTKSGSCFCDQGTDGRQRCYMDLNNVTRHTRQYWPLGGPCNNNPPPPPAPGDPGAGPEIADQDIP